MLPLSVTENDFPIWRFHAPVSCRRVRPYIFVKYITIKKIFYHEKKFQLKDEAYWTRDAGLVSGKTGERTTSRDGGYVRCVYKSKGLLK